MRFGPLPFRAFGYDARFKNIVDLDGKTDLKSLFLYSLSVLKPIGKWKNQMPGTSLWSHMSR